MFTGVGRGDMTLGHLCLRRHSGHSSYPVHLDKLRPRVGLLRLMVALDHGVLGSIKHFISMLLFQEGEHRRREAATDRFEQMMVKALFFFFCGRSESDGRWEKMIPKSVVPGGGRLFVTFRPPNESHLSAAPDRKTNCQNAATFGEE